MQNDARAKSVIFIAPEDLLSTWSSKAAPPDLLTLADADVDHALAVIERRHPHVVVISRPFAASERGVTFVNRIQANAALTDVQVRVLSEARSAVLRASGPVAGELIACVSRSLKYCEDIPKSTRRAPRVPAPIGFEVQIDEVRTSLVNVSTVGLQIVSPVPLRPNSTVKVVIAHGGIDLCTPAAIAWSSWETERSSAAYRAGVAFGEPQMELLKFEPAVAKAS